MFDASTLAAARAGLSLLLSYLGTALPYLLFGAGVWFLLITRGVQLRLLGRAVRGARDGGTGLAAMLAGTAGVGSIAAAALALGSAGPGAIVWMWLAAFLGMGISWVEVRVRTPAGAPAGETSRLGGVFAFLHALALLVTAFLVGGLFQVEQTAEVARIAWGVRPEITGVVLAALIAPLALLPRRRTHGWLSRIVVAALGIYLVTALAVLLANTQATGAALSSIFAAAASPGATAGGLLSGGLVVALHTAALRSTLASEVGLGTAAGDLRLDEDARASAALSAMLVPALTTGVVTTLTALVMLVGGASNHEQAGERVYLPLAQMERTKIRPSAYGQSFTLPGNTLLEANHRYPMTMLSNPRGHKTGTVATDGSVITMPAWDIARDVNSVLFRYKDERGRNPAFDVEVPCEREVRTVAGLPWLELRPVGLSTDLRTFIRAKELDGPYVRLADMPFTGTVLRTSEPGEDGGTLGESLTMIEEERDGDAPYNPTLRTVVVLEFAGPYNATDTRPPWAIIAAEGFDAPPGSVAHLRMLSPSRGLELGYINNLGTLSVPPWEFLADADTAVLRHRQNPALDQRLPVRGAVKGNRLIFESAARDFTFADIKTLGDFEPRPYIVAPPYRFTAEVHTGTRFPLKIRERAALIPFEPYDAALPLQETDTLRRANPREVLASDMLGPFVEQDGAGVITRAVGRTLPAPFTWLAALATGLLAAGATAVWARHAGRAVATVTTARALWLRRAVAGLVVVAAAVGAVLPFHQLLGAVDAAITIALEIQLVALLLLTPKVLNAVKDPR